jgi:hypothetical protein
MLDTMPSVTLSLAASAVGYLTPQRAWLDHLALIVPGDRATRWLLLVDAACLVMIGLQCRRRALAVPLAIGLGFLALNVIGMALTEFVLGLAVFHIAVTATASLALRRARWVGLAALGLVLLVGGST